MNRAAGIVVVCSSLSSRGSQRGGGGAGTLTLRRRGLIVSLSNADCLKLLDQWVCGETTAIASTAAAAATAVASTASTQIESRKT